MNKHLRILLPAALLLFIAVVPRAASAADIDGALSYAPKDAFAVSGVHGDKVKRSQLYKKLLEMILSKSRDKKKLDELSKETGFDPRRDITSIVAAAPDKVLKDDDAFVIVAEARVNEQRVIAFIKKEGKDIEQKTGPHGSYYLLGKRKEGAMAFRGKFVIVAGAVVMDSALAKTGPAPALTAVIDKVKQRHAFAVFVPPKKVRTDMGRDVPALGKANLMWGSIDLSRGAKLEVSSRFDDEKAAQQAEAIAREGLAQAGGDAKLKKMKLEGLVNQVTMTRAGNQLDAALTLSQKDLDSMLKMLAIFM